ncbi:MAG TPA: glycosyltransferase family 2 protein [Rhodanobacteraceae bacterium]|nr:glycosyltransferase family 2 protein [Rhodanobacteraceae bacterium]
MADSPACCVLIPCLNEELAIGAVVQSVLAQGLPVVVIDDGSDDATVDIVSRMPVTLIRHPARRGKGEALRSGFRHALAAGYRGALSMDGDGQHSAADLPRLLAVATAWPHHIVIGARLINRDEQPVFRRRANDFGDWGISWACGQRLTDTQSGQRYYPREVLELVDIEAEGFVFESEILIEANWQRGVRVVAVPIESRYEKTHHAGPRRFRVSHFRPLKDFLGITTRVVWKIVRRGCMWDSRRRARADSPLIVDPTAEQIRPFTVAGCSDAG